MKELDFAIHHKKDTKKQQGMDVGYLFAVLILGSLFLFLFIPGRCPKQKIKPIGNAAIADSAIR